MICLKYIYMHTKHKQLNLRNRAGFSWWGAWGPAYLGVTKSKWETVKA